MRLRLTRAIRALSPLTAMIKMIRKPFRALSARLKMGWILYRLHASSRKASQKLRDFAIRFIHAPLLSLASGFKWTDTTQGFRAYRRRMLLDPKIAPFRAVF